MHLHPVQLRWGDLDANGHVNNVRYVEFADEALQHGPVVLSLDAGSLVATSVRFERPASLRDGSVTVRTGPGGDGVVVQEVMGGGERDGTVLARVTRSVSTEPAAYVAPVRAVGFACQARRADADADGLISPSRHIEYYQEGRMTLDSFRTGAPGHGFVLAQTDVTYVRPLHWRSEPYDVHMWVDRVGTSSFRIRAQLQADGVVHSASVATLVAFDFATRRTRPLDADQRRAVGALMLDPA